MITRFNTIFIIIFSLLSCNTNYKNPAQKIRPGKDEMADLNTYFVQKDRERIQNYIERKNLPMSESPTGLWYMITNEGSGRLLTDNDVVVMDYDCSLLDGTNCYSSKEDGPKKILLGKSQLEPGLNEGLHMLKEGAEATFILPPYMAFGLIGDGKKIPSRAALIYNVTILHSPGKLE